MVQANTAEELAKRADTGRCDDDWHRADIICGGFPCQDVSYAGPGTGLAGARSGLWSYLCGAIRMVRPLYAIVENVAALLNRGMGTVLGDLAEIGYDAEWHCIPASAVGAEHERDRLWIVAYPDEARQLQPEGCQQDQRRRSGDGAKTDVAHTDETRCTGGLQAGADRKNVGVVGPRLRLTFDDADNVPREYWDHKPVLGRGIHGVPDRLDRIGALGNAVYPKIPEIIGRAIIDFERGL